MKKTLFFLIALLAINLLPSHSYAQDTNQHNTEQTLDNLKNKRWTLEQASSRANVTQLIHLSYDSLHHGLIVSTGCDKGFLPLTHISLKKDLRGTVHTGTFISHQSSCVNVQNKLQNKFISQISNQKIRFEIQADQLILTNKNKQQLIFTYNPINPMLKYVERFYWKLIQFKGDSSKVYHPYIAFNFHNNTFSGSNGCSPIEGTFEVNQQSTQLYFKIDKQKKFTCAMHQNDKISEEFNELLDDKTYYFDVADQTLNLYQDNKIIFMFGVINKNALPTPSSTH